MRISIEEFEKYYCRRTRGEPNGTYITKPQHERRNADARLDCTVYEVRLPKFTNETEAKKCFSRLANFLTRNIDAGTVAILGLSNHKKWTPFRYEQGKKGGRAKKIFDNANTYKVPPHIHLNIAGSGAYRTADKLFKNESRLYQRKHKRPFPKARNEVIWSKQGQNFSREYIQWQSTLYREFGKVDDFITDHEYF